MVRLLYQAVPTGWQLTSRSDRLDRSIAFFHAPERFVTRDYSNRVLHIAQTAERWRAGAYDRSLNEGLTERRTWASIVPRRHTTVSSAARRKMNAVERELHNGTRGTKCCMSGHAITTYWC